MSSERHNFCTYFDWNYWAKGVALWESLEWTCPGYHLWILALDDGVLELLTQLVLPNVSVISMAAFETPELWACRPPARSQREFYWTCTPAWMLYVLRGASLGSVNYVDADIYFYANPQPVFDEIGDAPLGITPHDFPARLRSFEGNGIFNVGLAHAKVAGIPCLEEWRRQCIEWCFLRHDPQFPDRFCDQKYLDPWPERWRAHVVRHKGANRAPWNMEKYQYTVAQDGRVLVDGEPLLWFHYHGFVEGGEIHPETYQSNALQREHIFKPYGGALRRAHGRAGG